MAIIKTLAALTTATLIGVAALVACGAPDETATSVPATRVVSADAGRGLASASVAPCDEEAIFDVVADALSDARVTIVGVSIHECDNGYARVYAIPDNSTCDPGSPDSECFDEEQVFLIDRDGTWEILTYGSGIECWNPTTLTPRLVAACGALGLLHPDGTDMTLPGTE